KTRRRSHHPHYPRPRLSIGRACGSTGVMTIRRRLLLLLLPALAVLMVVGGLVDYWIAVTTTGDAFDRALASTALAAVASPQSTDETAAIRYPPLATAVLRG